MPKNSRENIAARRSKVWEMMVRGVKNDDIAQALGVHRNTIINDTKELRKEHRVGVQDADVHGEIGDIVAKYDEIFRFAMVEFTTAEKPTQKAQFLEKAMGALSKKVSLLVETGVLPKAAQEITGKMIIQGVDVSSASLQELKTLRENMMTKAPKESGTNRIAGLLDN